MTASTSQFIRVLKTKLDLARDRGYSLSRASIAAQLRQTTSGGWSRNVFYELLQGVTKPSESMIPRIVTWFQSIGIPWDLADAYAEAGIVPLGHIPVHREFVDFTHRASLFAQVRLPVYDVQKANRYGLNEDAYDLSFRVSSTMICLSHLTPDDTRVYLVETIDGPEEEQSDDDSVVVRNADHVLIKTTREQARREHWTMIGQILATFLLEAGDDEETSEDDDED